MNNTPITIFWHRRDLRIHDNAGLYHALIKYDQVQPVFIFDENILKKLNKNDARVTFIFNEIVALKQLYQTIGTDLKVYYGKPVEIFSAIIQEYNIASVVTNSDYEPYANERDTKVLSLLNYHNIAFELYKDHVIFEKNEILKDDGKPYTIFTPYSKRWLQKLAQIEIPYYDCSKQFHHLVQSESTPLIPLEKMGFNKSLILFPDKNMSTDMLINYAKNRDYPAIDATSHLGIHFRFGTISIREKLKKALAISPPFVNEIIWRDFFIMIMHHFPYAMQSAFKPMYNHIKWDNNEVFFDKWCNGETGYAIVDAGMRELNTTGFMHNRVRMITASFLCKHLLIDWRWGETYFAEKLLDFELASNNGNWQWAAGCGCDAAPYFRVFNPVLQEKKFDQNQEYIKKWIPEYNDSKSYITPIVEHSSARNKAIQRYQQVVKNNLVQ